MLSNDCIFAYIFRFSYSCEDLFCVHTFVLKLPGYYLKVLAVLKAKVVKVFSQDRPSATMGNIGDVLTD